MEQISPAATTVGLVIRLTFILDPDEQASYRKFISEIKQISALVILVTGIAIQEMEIISQKTQELIFVKTLEKSYNDLCRDNTIGKRVSSLPLNFLIIGTGRAKEVLTRIKIRKKYSAMKSYMNDALAPLWRR